MTLEQIKEKVRGSYYMEDDTIIDVSIACIIANRLKLGDPVWMTIIGASSGGKSQILRPLALTDKKYLHIIDDITENTFLSGSTSKGNKDVSLLSRIGKEGMLSISDLTVLFSRNAESRNAILSQFRMLYDGKMTKLVGNKDTPLVWEGFLGVMAGSTPSIYTHMEEVADMGERFMYFRMKPYDERKASQVALSRPFGGKRLDEELSDLYAEYIKSCVVASKDDVVTLDHKYVEEIIDIAIFAEKLRTINKIDKFSKEIERIPTTAMPMRTAIQLLNIAKAIYLIRKHDGKEFQDSDMDIIYWLGWSLGNEEKRALLEILFNQTYEVTTQSVADKIGLNTNVVRGVLQNLASTKLIQRSGDGGGHKWKIESASVYKILERILIKKEIKLVERDAVEDEITEEDSDVF
jgi:predicted transcriptional regulator